MILTLMVIVLKKSQHNAIKRIYLYLSQIITIYIREYTKNVYKII